MMKQKIVEGFVICVSAFIIVKGDWAYEKLFPAVFWNQKVAMLEQRERSDLWRVHREEWHLKRAELDLSFALKVAEDEALCLDKNSKECAQRAKEPFLTKMDEIQKNLAVAKWVYKQTQERLNNARSHSVADLNDRSFH